MIRRLFLCGGLAASMLLPPGAPADEPNTPTESASETDPAVPAAGHSIHGEAFNEGPRQRAILLSGMGEIDFPVTSRSAEAGAFFAQGVAQLHTFYFLEAERSFRQAAMLDPDCPMAYWGMALANTNNAKRAKAFAAETKERAGRVELTPRERLYIDALSARHKEEGDDKGRRQGWVQGLEAIVQEFPDDLDARTLLALAIWEHSSRGDGIGSRQAVEELLRSVERVAPMHPGVHHYRIHLWDGHKPKLALKSAALYGPAAPGIAHAWHMPGHTYSGVKRYAEAAAQQEASARVDHAAMMRDRIMPFEIHNYAHNNQWFCTSASHVGRVRDAIAVARNLVEQPRDPQKNGPNDGGSPQRSGRARWSELLVRYELWDDLIEATESGAIDWSDSVPLEKKERAYTLGLAYAAKQDAARLAEQIEALKAMRQAPEAEKADAKSPEEAEPADDARPADDAKPVEPTRHRGRAPGVEPAIAELEARLLHLEGKNDEALKRLEKATSMRSEAKARLLLDLGQAEKAVEEAKKAVNRGENQLPPLACLVEILDRVGRTDEAREAYRTLATLAREADRDLPVLRRIEALAARWQSSGWQSAMPAPEPESVEVRPTGIDPESLGPLTWTPYGAEPFALLETGGGTISLEDFRGKSNVLVIFYLGGRCAHCMQQLQAFGEEIEPLRSLGTELLAIGTDDIEAARGLKQNKDGIKFPMPLLADPELAAFKAYRCFDDFEAQPLHGTFLIDREGRVRYQRISADPFLDVEFLKGEASRINRLKGPGH